MAQRNGRCGSQLRSGWNLLFVHVADLEKRVHPPLLATRAAYRLHESPLLRIYESQLQSHSRSHQKHDRNNQRARQRFTQSCSQTPSAHHLSKLWRPAQAAFLDSAIENFGVVRIGGYRINQSLFSERLSLGAAAQRDGGSLGVKYGVD